MAPEISPGLRRTIAGAILISVLVCIGANALLYTVKACNPLVSADDWVFVDWIVRKMAAGQLAFPDLFATRSQFDHAQPLRRLILLLHYRYFDLDFGIAALIGVMASFANVGMLWLLVRHGTGRRSEPTALAMAGFAALSAVYLSLNAPVVFNWSLLTLGYTSHAFILVFLIASWCAYRHPRPWPLLGVFAAAFAMDVVADAVGLITTTAALLTLAMFGARRRGLDASIRVSIAALVAYGAYRLLRAVIALEYISRSNVPEPSLAARLSRLVDHGGTVVSTLGIPFIAPVAHRNQLTWMLGDALVVGEAAILGFVLLLHGWFWWRAWRGRHNAAAFVAIAMMWMFYGTVIATVVVRLSLYQPGYLWQPRYVLLYVWNLMALLLMAISQLPRVDENAQGAAALEPGLRPAGQLVMALGAVLLLGLQVPMSTHSWSTVKYRSTYLQRRAAWLDELASHPVTNATPCDAGSGNCGNYVNVARFLRDRQLSVFSPAFRLRNRLYPTPDTLPLGPPDKRAQRALSNTSSR
ncbi:MAG: hypothetical protein ACJ8GK_00620 [Luteimonas sp.]